MRAGEKRKFYRNVEHFRGAISMAVVGLRFAQLISPVLIAVIGISATVYLNHHMASAGTSMAFAAAAGALNPARQGKIDVALSNLAQKYRNNQLVGERLFPRVNAMKQSDKYWLFGREGQQLTENDLRARGASAEQIRQAISTDSYLAEDHALAAIIDEQERAGFEAGNVEQWKTEALMDKILLGHENRVATLATTLATYPAANRVTLAGVNQWNEGTQVSTPIENVLTGHLKVMETGKRANILIIGPEVWTGLKTNKEITARVSPTKTGPVSTEDLASIFEVDEVIVAAAVKLDAAGAASFIWGKHAILAYSQPASSTEDVSFGKTFVWNSAPGTVGGFETLIGQFGAPSAKSDELSVHYYYDLKVTSNISAYFIQNAVA